jgi:hypothetical protein
LDDESRDRDNNEEIVSEDTLEDIEGSSKYSGINLIEDLHENEDLEHICHVKKLLCIRSFFTQIRCIEVSTCSSSEFLC